MYVFGVIALGSLFLTGSLLAFFGQRKTKIAGLTLVILAIAFTALRLGVERQWATKFSSLPDGLAEAELRDRLLWETFDFSDGKSPVGYSLHEHTPSVKHEVWYVQFFQPGQYAFGFDESGRLVVRYHYQSP